MLGMMVLVVGVVEAIFRGRSFGQEVSEGFLVLFLIVLADIL